MHKKMMNALVTVLALIGLLVGIVFLISPIPIGVIIIAINLAILLCVNNKARQQLQALRTRSHKVNRYLFKFEEKLEKRFIFLWGVFTGTRPAAKKAEEVLDKGE